MAKTKQTWPSGKDKSQLIVLLGLFISISVIIFLWKYYDARILDMEQQVNTNSSRETIENGD